MLTRSTSRQHAVSLSSAAELAEHTLLASLDILTSAQVESIQAEAAAMTPAEVTAMLSELGISPGTETA